MQFQFDNTAEHVGTRGELDWYEWTVFMDEPPEKLNHVSRVEYHLHESFPDAIRVSENRATRFALSSAGWGEFMIFITVYLNSGREFRTQHHLDLGDAKR